MTIQQYLHQTTNDFEAAGIISARLDAQVLICSLLKQNKAWLLAHGERKISPEILPQLLDITARRARREPIAYILGRKEFYGRDFLVSPEVLIPRPATEQLIDEIKALPLADQPKILDVGTGSGIIAVTLNLEMPQSRVEASDIDSSALQIAEKNAEKLGAQQIRFFESDLLQHASHDYDCIAANLPYVDESWQCSPETAFEPKKAIFAKDNGLIFIKTLFLQTPKHLKSGGFLVLEADPRQFDNIKKIAEPGFEFIKIQDFCAVFSKR